MTNPEYTDLKIYPHQKWRLRRLSLVKNKNLIETFESLIWEEEKRLTIESRKSGDKTIFNVLTTETENFPKSVKCGEIT